MGLGRVKKDDTENKLLSNSHIQTLGTWIANDWIYYNMFDFEQPMHQYRMKIDGTEYQPIPKVLVDE